MWGVLGETIISELRFPENTFPGRILFSDYYFFFFLIIVLLHVHRTDPIFEKNKVCMSLYANID